LYFRFGIVDITTRKLVHSTSWIQKRERNLTDEQEFYVSGNADDFG
jgi:hypothetical protein